MNLCTCEQNGLMGYFQTLRAKDNFEYEHNLAPTWCFKLFFYVEGYMVLLN